MLDRPAAGRARRAVRAGLARRGPAVGQPRRSRGQPSQAGRASATRRSRPCSPTSSSAACLDETLVHLGRRIRTHADGRTAHAGQQCGKMNGRDHNHYGFTMWLAGGGVRAGYVHGATDEFGFQAVEKKVHVHDLHATILHLLGFDHERVHLSLRRPRLPPDRRARARGSGADRLGVSQRQNMG